MFALILNFQKDFAYYFGYMTMFTPDGGYMNDTEVDEFFKVYLENYTGSDKNELSVELLREELDIHSPYAILEQSVFQG